MNNLPVFFNYKEEGGTDQGYEAIQDFFLSWTLRCSKEAFKKDNFLINFYSKRILFSLLYGQNSESELKVDFSNFNSFKVLEIKTKRQSKRIDLLAELKVEVDGKPQDFILNIENKYYSSIGKDQLKKYVPEIHENYDLIKSKLINVVIFCDDTILKSDLSQIENCQQNGYFFTNVDELASLADVYNLGYTGNYLFDEFWCEKRS